MNLVKLIFVLFPGRVDITDSPIKLSQTNLIAICTSLGVVVIALIVIIGCFVVRHRRLQRSFHAYARSHYDSHSGTTTFSAAEELGMCSKIFLIIS